MPAAVDDDPLVAVDHGPVPVADSMHAGNRHSAAFGVEKVNRLQNRLPPDVRVDSELTSEGIPGLQKV